MRKNRLARLGVITGLRAEARIAVAAAEKLPEERRPLVLCAGASAARDGGRRLAAAGAGALLSFGMAGGLDATLRPGTLVVAEAVIAPDGRRFAVDAAWRGRLSALAGGACPPVVAAIAGSARAVTSTADRKALFEASGAVAVDMESHGVAAAAAEAGLPFLAVRAVADPAGRAVPPAALAGLTPDGRMRMLPVLARVLLRPWELPALIRLAGDSGLALAALRRVAALDPAGFAFFA